MVIAPPKVKTVPSIKPMIIKGETVLGVVEAVVVAGAGNWPDVWGCEAICCPKTSMLPGTDVAGVLLGSPNVAKPSVTDGVSGELVVFSPPLLPAKLSVGVAGPTAPLPELPPLPVFVSPLSGVELLVVLPGTAAVAVAGKLNRVGVGGCGNVPAGMRVGERSIATVGEGCGVVVGLTEGEVAALVVVGTGVEPVGDDVAVGVWVGELGVVPAVVGTGVLMVVPPRVVALRGPSKE